MGSETMNIQELEKLNELKEKGYNLTKINDNKVILKRKKYYLETVMLQRQ